MRSKVSLIVVVCLFVSLLAGPPGPLLSGSPQPAYADGGDTTAPSAISDLTVMDDQINNDYWKWSATSLRLSWTAPGDDGTVGQAVYYDIRYSTQTITEANWAAATAVVGEPAPAPAGSAESLIARWLRPNTTYYFAMKTVDEAGNVSALSNVGSKKTTQADGFTFNNTYLFPESGGGSVTSLIDKNTATAWEPTSYPAVMKVDFGYTWGGIRSVNKIRVYEAGGSGELKIYYGRPGAWSLLVSAPFTGISQWREFEVNVLSASFRFEITSPSGDAKISEIEMTGRGAPPDSVPPSAVADLAAGNGTANTLQLTWTAPGNDNDMRGFADQYDIRYSTSPITEANWASASQATGEPAPLEAGTVQTMTVGGLAPQTTYYFAIKSSDKNYTNPQTPYINTSGISNIAAGATTTAPNDTTPPAAIANLTATAPTASTVTLQWTAPGDDGNVGTASAYEVRYSTSAITEANWGSATVYAQTMAPQPASSAETLVVSGLTAGTTYYFAVKAKDDAANVSAVSNSASGTTLSASNDTTPPAAIANLTVTSPTASSVTLQWTAPGDDGNVGTASAYEVRYSTSAITSVNWGSATVYAQTMAPQPAGSAETLVVGGLAAGTTYYFAVKAKDKATNVSALSNVISLATSSGGSSNGTGLEYETYDNIDFTAFKKRGLLDGSNQYPAFDLRTWTVGFPTDSSTFSVRVTGYVEARYSEAYTFYVKTSATDRVRLWIDRKLLVDTWDSPTATEQRAVPIQLTAGHKYEVHLELKALDAGSQAIVRWSSASQAKEIVSLPYLYPPADTTPPNAIAAVSATALNSRLVRLAFAAPGDDDLMLPGRTQPWGNAASYDIRYSTSPITEANWASATQTPIVAAQQPAGGSESVTIGGLVPETRYYFAIKAKDEANNVSPLSNMADATTLPLDTVSPAPVTDLAISAPSASYAVQVSWKAPGDDGHTGTAAAYDLRYSESPITDSNWAQATKVSGLPAPQAAGTVQSVNVQLLADSTYYFALRTIDNEPNVSALSNVPSVAVPAPDLHQFVQISLKPSMVTNETAWKDATLLVDEQTSVGDPLHGTGAAPNKAWIPNGSYYGSMEHAAIIDLGATYQLDHIFLYDVTGNSGNYTVSAGTPFHWTALFTDPLNRASSGWARHDVNVQTRYVQVKLANGNINMPEIVLYGSRESAKVPEPTPQPNEWATMDKLMGLNTFIDDPVDKIALAGNAREYHNWAWDEGDYRTYPGYPNNENAWSPSYAGGGWDFDAYYTKLHSLGVSVSPVIQATVPWINSGGKPIASGADALTPASYAAHADHMFQIVARYGSTAVNDSLLKLRADQPRSTGLNVVNYYEDWNEGDNWWASRNSFFTPYEYATMASADYDGHRGAMGGTFGVKNADPNAKMVMMGLADPDLQYVKAMKLWADEYRGGSFPADVINVHHYSNDVGNQTEGTIGVSPEANRLKERMEQFVQYRDRYLPGKEFWLSEFGYDTNQQSPFRAPEIGPFTAEEVQGQWLTRAFLALAAAGVDKAQMFMLRDSNADSATQFDSMGLVGMYGDWTPKTSFYYLYTMKNRLAGLRFETEQSSGNPNVMIYRFVDAANQVKAYALWSPTSSAMTVNGYELTLQGAPSAATLVTMAHGSTKGIPTALAIDGGKVTVDVGERPVFVMIGDQPLDRDTPPVWPAGSGLALSNDTGTTVQLTWNAAQDDNGIAAYRIYKDEAQIGSVLGSLLTYTVRGLAPNSVHTYRIEAVDAVGQSTSEPLRYPLPQPSLTPLPFPWTAVDMGDVGVYGDSSYAQGTFTLNVSGNDIWNRKDDMRFAYQQMEGDGTFIARVASQGSSDIWAKAGLMIRQSLDANARNAFMFVSASQGAAFQWRTNIGGETKQTAKAGYAAPSWVKLVRAGKTFTGYVSADGVNWVQVGTANVTMDRTVYVGLAATSHARGVLNTATFDHVAPVFATIGNQTANTGQAVTFTVYAEDPQGNALTYSADRLPAGASFDPATKVFAWTPDASQRGTYVVRFVASGGAFRMSKDVAIAVNGAPQWTPPGSWTVRAGQTVTFAVYAADPDGDALTYQASNMPAGASFSAANVFSWTPDYSQAGTYTPYFTVSDGKMSVGASATITVANATVAERVADLRSFIDGLTIHAGIQSSLIAKVDGLSQAVQNGNIAGARGKAGALNNEIAAQKGKKLTIEQAEALKRLVDGIIAEL